MTTETGFLGEMWLPMGYKTSKNLCNTAWWFMAQLDPPHFISFLLLIFQLSARRSAFHFKLT